MTTVELTGDWEKLKKALGNMASGPALRASMHAATLREAHILRGHIVKGLTAQAPGGVPIKPLSALTLAARRMAGFSGTKALIRTGQLRNSISVQSSRQLEVFVGVTRKARSKRVKGQKARPLVDIARIHEFGAGPFVVKMTPKQRRFLAILYRQAGLPPRSGPSRVGILVIKIPARPFIRPVFEKYAKPADVARRIMKRVAKDMGVQLDPPP